MNLPSVIPVMLLQQCNVFPHALLPLYIFENRYREMLKHALQTDRMLGIGCLSPAQEEDAPETDDRIDDFTTASVIRACVGNEDGTSHLVLQGLQRVRLVSWEQYTPFRIARIEALPTLMANPGDAETKRVLLLDRVLGLVQQNAGAVQQLADQMQKLTDPGNLADFVAANLVRDPGVRQPLIGMTEVSDRLDYLLNLLPEPGPHPAKP